jgi:uncharacterized protein (DUF2345 family)
MSTSYPWIIDSQYGTTPTTTGYLQVVSPNGLYLYSTDDNGSTFTNTLSSSGITCISILDDGTTSTNTLSSSGITCDHDLTIASTGNQVNINSYDNINISAGVNFNVTASDNISLKANNDYVLITGNKDVKLTSSEGNIQLTPTYDGVTYFGEVYCNKTTDNSGDGILNVGTINYTTLNPPISTPTLEQVLTARNTSIIPIILEENLENITSRATLSSRALLMNNTGTGITASYGNEGISTNDLYTINSNNTLTLSSTIGDIDITSSANINLITPLGNVNINGSAYPPAVNILEAVLTAGNIATDKDIVFINTVVGPLTTTLNSGSLITDGGFLLQTYDPLAITTTQGSISLTSTNDDINLDAELDISLTSQNSAINLTAGSNNSGTNVITLTAPYGNIDITSGVDITLQAETTTGGIINMNAYNGVLINGYQSNSTTTLNGYTIITNEENNPPFINEMNLSSASLSVQTTNTVSNATSYSIISPADLELYTTTDGSNSSTITLTPTTLNYQRSGTTATFFTFNYTGNEIFRYDTSGITMATGKTITGNFTGTATSATAITITESSSTAGTFYPTFVNSDGSGKSVRIDLNMTYSTTTDTLTCTNFAGNATSSTTATNSTNVGITSDNTSGTYYIPFVKTSGTGNKGLFIDDTTTPFTFNPNTSTLTATNFAGNATTATTATNATNVGITNTTTTAGTYYPTFSVATTGNTPMRVDNNHLFYFPSTNTFQNPNFLVAETISETATNGGMLIGYDGTDTKKIEIRGANSGDRRRLRIATRSSAVSGAGDTEIFLSNTWSNIAGFCNISTNNTADSTSVNLFMNNGKQSEGVPFGAELYTTITGEYNKVWGYSNGYAKSSVYAVEDSNIEYRMDIDLFAIVFKGGTPAAPSELVRIDTNAGMGLTTDLYFSSVNFGIQNAQTPTSISYTTGTTLTLNGGDLSFRNFDMVISGGTLINGYTFNNFLVNGEYNIVATNNTGGTFTWTNTSVHRFPNNVDFVMGANSIWLLTMRLLKQSGTNTYFYTTTKFST